MSEKTQNLNVQDDKEVEIEYNTREGEQMYLKERLVMGTEKY